MESYCGGTGGATRDTSGRSNIELFPDDEKQKFTVEGLQVEEGIHEGLARQVLCLRVDGAGLNWQCCHPRR
jgi:hypothetical protein